MAASLGSGYSTGSLPVIHSVLCLRLLCNALVQESRKATSKTKALDNFFTFSFKHNYSYACCGLLRAVLNPITYLFHLSHVLLLALVLCPSSRIINLDSKETDESHSQPRLHARLRWVRSKSLTDLKARRSLLMSSAVLLLITLSTLYDCTEPSQSQANYHFAQVYVASAAALTLVRGAPGSYADTSLYHCNTDHTFITDTPGKAMISSSSTARPSTKASHKDIMKLIVDSGASFHLSLIHI